jgi:hypothetical protein
MWGSIINMGLMLYIWRKAYTRSVISADAANFNHPSLLKFTYAPVQAFLDSEQLYTLDYRSKKFIFKPYSLYKREGIVNEVCFEEGLVFLN